MYKLIDFVILLTVHLLRLHYQFISFPYLVFVRKTLEKDIRRFTKFWIPSLLIRKHVSYKFPSTQISPTF